MRRPLAAAALLTASCAAWPGERQVPPQVPSEWDDGRIEVEKPNRTFDAVLGTRKLEDEAAWAPLGEQAEFGISFQTPFLGTRSEARLDLADYFDWDVSIRFAYDDARVTPPMATDSVSVGSRTWDVGGGLLFVPFAERTMLQPYVGGGVALLFTDVRWLDGSNVRSDTGAVLAGYLRGGLRIQLTKGRYFGADARWVSDGADVDGVGASASSLALSFLFGASF
ncbi:MAG: hypothetical protein AAF957_26320 [Planctomycetota bacterium]